RRSCAISTRRASFPSRSPSRRSSQRTRSEVLSGSRQQHARREVKNTMLTKEQNDLLTQTGPGTPGGELLRRFWQPVGLTEELPEGGAPVPVKVLGEELVLYRDETGRPGLLGLHCSHRGADLSYGRIEDGGLRCLYHGWLYDIRGRALEQPGEPGGGAPRRAICHLAYPGREAGGVMAAYRGPGPPPLLPH